MDLMIPSYSLNFCLICLEFVRYNMFKIAILFCDLDRLLWTLSIPTDAFISNVSIATPDSFSLVLLPGKSSSILLPSICVRLHALGVSRYIGFLKI